MQHFRSKSKNTSLGAKDFKDESLRLIKNHCQMSNESTHEYGKKKKKKTEEKPDVIYCYNFTLLGYV